ncbi:MAG TPA: zinc ABC transporter substrate-binding protein [Anaerolineales bacterium]|nr:zinc ABC transporter substrate-binding protein [Anaerolineales bacterium]
MSNKFLVSLLCILTFSACTPGTSSPDGDGRIRVVATIGQIADAAQIVGGEHAAVNGLMGSGVDPHLYLATEGDVGLLQEADIIFYNGLHLEAQMANILGQLGAQKTVVPVGEAVPPDRLIGDTSAGGIYDPHIWFDVPLWMVAVEAIRDAYIAHDPENRADYEANAAAYLEQLAALHVYVSEQAARVPEPQRALVTAHDAFTYFGRAYGFDVRGLQGISTASEAGTGDVQDLAAFIVERQIRAIFIESSVPVRNVEALQAAAAAVGWQVEIGGELFSDAMGDPGTPEGTYIGMVEHNIDTIVNALLGETGGE